MFVPRAKHNRPAVHLLPGQPVAVGAAQFVGVAAAAGVDHRRTAAFALGRLRPFQRGRVVGQDPAPDEILAGDMEIALRADVVGRGRMAGEGDAMLCTPVVERSVPGLLHAQGDGAGVIGPVAVCVRLVVVPESGQVGGEVVAQ